MRALSKNLLQVRWLAYCLSMKVEPHVTTLAKGHCSSLGLFDSKLASWSQLSKLIKDQEDLSIFDPVDLEKLVSLVRTSKSYSEWSKMRFVLPWKDIFLASPEEKLPNLFGNYAFFDSELLLCMNPFFVDQVFETIFFADERRTSFKTLQFYIALALNPAASTQIASVFGNEGWMLSLDFNLFCRMGDLLLSHCSSAREAREALEVAAGEYEPRLTEAIRSVLESVYYWVLKHDWLGEEVREGFWKSFGENHLDSNISMVGTLLRDGFLRVEPDFASRQVLGDRVLRSLAARLDPVVRGFDQ